MQPGTRYHLEVNPRIPKRLARLEELAGNLWYSWDRPTRALFARLNPALWDAVGHNPKAMLKRIDEQRLIDAAADPAFLDSLTRVLAAFDAYHAEPPFRQQLGRLQGGRAGRATSAPSSACTRACRSTPAASASWRATTARRRATSSCRSSAVGLLYRQGYFVQTIDGEGSQRADYHDSDFDDLPIDAGEARTAAS